MSEFCLELSFVRATQSCIRVLVLLLPESDLVLETERIVTHASCLRNKKLTERRPVFSLIVLG